MEVKTRNDAGNPACPVCAEPVERAGEFDTAECYQHFLLVVQDQATVVEMEQYLDHTEMPWYSQDV